MRYKIIDIEKARDLARKKLSGDSVDWEPYEQEAGKSSGGTLPDNVLKDVAKALLKLKLGIEKQGGSREDLDARAFPIVHGALPRDFDGLGDSRFWVRFAVVYLFDLIRWRFPGKKGEFNLENLGIAGAQRKQAENYLYKLWVRGELSYRAGKDPYKLGRAGDIDFWTSHIHRQGFASCRTLASQLVAFQYPPELKGNPRLFAGQESASQRGVRTLVKRIRRMWATVEYSLLDATELQQLIQELSKGLTVAHGKSIST